MRRVFKRPSLALPESLEGVLARAGEDRFARYRAPFSAELWKAVVGVRVAERARPLHLQRGVLTVRAVSSAWANELSLLGAQILARLRDRGVEANEMRFQVGALEPRTQPAPQRRAKRIPAPVPLSAELTQTLASVEDDELRAVISGAIGAQLAWQEHTTPVSDTTRAAPAPQAAETESAPRAQTTASSSGAGSSSREEP